MIMSKFTKFVSEYIFLHPFNMKYAIMFPCEKNKS